MPYYRLFYHFVWATKNRLPLITAAVRETLYANMRDKVIELEGQTHALNGMAEHVHLVATVPPKIALSEFVRQVKGSSSHWVNQTGTEKFVWQREYGVLSVSESHLPIVVRYVLEQEKHHAQNRLDERLERIDEDKDS